MNRFHALNNTPSSTPYITSQMNIREVLSRKGLEVAISAGTNKRTWTNGLKGINPNTALADELSSDYRATEQLMLSLRRIASTATRYGRIDYAETGLSSYQVEGILNQMKEQGLLKSANTYTTGAYVSLGEGAGPFLQKEFAVLHLVSVLRRMPGVRLDEMYYNCKLVDRRTGKQYAIDLIYRIGGSVYFINIALNPNILTMNNILTRLSENADRIRSNYAVVLSPNVSPLALQREIRNRTGGMTEMISPVLFDRLDYLPTAAANRRR